MSTDYKRPESVLVVVHTLQSQVLLLNRVTPQGFWQSVTGSLDWGELPTFAAQRELQEETGISIARAKAVSQHNEATGQLNKADILLHHPGINCFPIVSPWRQKYDPEVEYNFEHVFSVYLNSLPTIILSSKEHTEYQWLTKEIAIQRVTSYTNKIAINEIVPDSG